MNAPLQEAIRLAGGQEALASKIGVGQSLISYWLKKAKKGVAPEHTLAIEALTGVPRHRLRPDIYPLPSSVHDEPALTSDPAVIVPQIPQSADLVEVEGADRILPADAVRAGDAASTATACEPADSN